MKLSKTKLALLVILFLAAFLRLYWLRSYPPLNADEAAIGYNAWSLLKTGKDEYGDSWPIHFRSFGDYKPGAYFYLVLPLIKLVGFNELAVRLPSALMGVATVYLVYLVAKLLWKIEVLGLIWSAVLAISPWHIHFSRGGWESNVAVFLILLGVYLFFKKRYASPFPFILAMYTYHSARIIVPILVFGLFCFNFREVWQERKNWLKLFFLTIFLLLPLVFSFLKGGASTRFSGVGIFADQGPLWRVNELRGAHKNPDGLWPTIFHNRYLGYGISFAEKYFSHFDGRFLFIDGDEVPRSKVPDMGVMHFFEVGFLILGIWFWLRSKNEHKYLPFLWSLVAPLASAMTFQAPSALRALSMVVPLTFFVAYGIYKSLSLKLLIFLFYLWGFFYWQDRYFVHYLKRYPFAWPDFAPALEQIRQSSDKEEICLKGNWDQPYILTLFYLQYPPEKIQKEIRLTPPDQFGFSTVKNFGRFYFGDCP